MLILDGDERVLLQEQGGYKGNLRSGWKLGQVCLTNRRLLFLQATATRFNAPLDRIEALRVEAQRFLLKPKPVLAVISPRLKGWFSVREPERWREAFDRTNDRPFDEADVRALCAELEPRAAEILRVVWERGHARIDELAEDSNHMDVLLEIRERINPAAERRLGRRILVFERSRTDPVTGETVAFSWWPAGRVGRAALLDVLDEEGHFLVLAEFPGVREEEIRTTLEPGRLLLSAGGFRETVSLAQPVVAESLDRKFRNGILQVRIEKVMAR